MAKEISQDWDLVKLSTLCDLQNGFAFKSSDYIENSKTLVFRMSQIRKGGKLDLNHNSKYLPDHFNLLYEDYVLKDGDIAIAMTDLATETKILGVPTFFKADGRNFLLNQRVGRFKDINKERLDVQFLRYVLTSQNIRNYYKSFGKGALQINLGKSDILNVEIPLPPLKIQKDTVSIIEELFSELDNGIENLKIALEQLKVYRQSVLKWAFEGKLTNENVEDGKLPDGWTLITINEIVAKKKHSLKAGPFGSSLKKEFYTPSGYKIYGQEQVISGDPFLGNYYINEEKFIELESCKVQPFDILISLVGTVGKVLLLPENCEPGVINPRLIKISLNQDIYLPLFFKYYFESSSVTKLYSSKTRGTTMDVLNLGIIKTIPFPCCEIVEQFKVVQEIESRMTVADKIEDTIKQSLQQSESLRQSILKKAFEGNLI